METNTNQGKVEICPTCSNRKSRTKLKEKAVEYKGGKCQNCGYNKSLRALTFHHQNPDEKDFQIGGNHSRSWEVIKNELDKCDLLCSNCRHEEHEKIDIENRKRKT